MERADSRTPDSLREVSFLAGVAPHAGGSVLVSFGKTRVLCAAMIEPGVPGWMKQQRVEGGWLTAEYAMLPYSTLDRKPRDISRGKLDGRSSEIQRLIGRSLRAVIDLKQLRQNTLWVDCDVVQADGGTRTASITGACVAAVLAIDTALEKGQLVTSPMRKRIAAVSAGVCDGIPMLDLDYAEDKAATVDFNIVMTEDLEFVEVQGSGEEATFSSEELAAMLELSKAGVRQLCELQREAIDAARTPADGDALASLADHFKR